MDKTDNKRQQHSKTPPSIVGPPRTVGLESTTAQGQSKREGRGKRGRGRKGGGGGGEKGEV